MRLAVLKNTDGDTVLVNPKHVIYVGPTPDKKIIISTRRYSVPGHFDDIEAVRKELEAALHYEVNPSIKQENTGVDKFDEFEKRVTAAISEAKKNLCS